MPFTLLNLGGSTLPLLAGLLLLITTAPLPTLAQDSTPSGTLSLQQVLLPRNTTDTHAIPALFGNPPQKINLILSTTSAHSWVYGKTFCSSLTAVTRRSDCEASDSAAGGGSALYDETQSDKFTKIPGDFAYSGRNNQQGFKGFMGTDRVSIGGIDIPALEFGIVTAAEQPDASTLSITGVDGGIGGVLGIGEGSKFLKYLLDQKIITGNSFAVQLASKITFTDGDAAKTYPNRRIIPYDVQDGGDTAMSGSITLGGFDANRFGTNDTAPGGLSKDGEIMTTVSMVTSTWFDGASTNAISHTTEWKSPANSPGAAAVIDSTSPFILIPEKFWASMGPQWSRADVNLTTGRTYYVDGTAFRDWRNFTFFLVDTKNGNPRELTLQHFDWNVWDPEVNFWAPAFKLQPKGVETVVLGRPAMRALYANVDWEKRTARTVPVAKRANIPKAKIEKTNGAAGNMGANRVGGMVWALASVAVGIVVLF